MTAPATIYPRILTASLHVVHVHLAATRVYLICGVANSYSALTATRQLDNQVIDDELLQELSVSHRYLVGVSYNRTGEDSPVSNPNVVVRLLRCDHPSYQARANLGNSPDIAKRIGPKGENAFMLCKEETRLRFLIGVDAAKTGAVPLNFRLDQMAYSIELLAGIAVDPDRDATGNPVGSRELQ
ncbi:hypothetical protein CCHR01_04957 [Colletotrichum chrysophilum]|uniref:Uncharacterized protein n=1 Tax=Colletotrichum chrysophilum TaxID=1836956 RepID=A0AAD9AQ55_9PEZI|nr:hypothetical protein CCHR01_04957 [Colletotrichum chrysophilum]